MGCSSFVLTKKLQLIKSHLSWNREIFGEFQVEEQGLLSDMNRFDRLVVRFGLDEAKRAERSKHKAELADVHLAEDIQGSVVKRSGSEY